MESRSFVIPATNKSSVEKQIEKFNKRSKKIGLEPIVLNWGKAFMDHQQLLIPDLKDPSAPAKYIDKIFLAIPVDISGPLNVNHDGWQFFATIQHLSTGENIVRPIMDADIPKYYRTAGSDCHYCNTKRYRKDTYLVRHDTGELIQIGSTCIKQFLGDETPDNILMKANFIAELISFLEGSKKLDHGTSPGSGINLDELFHIEMFLAHTSASIRDYGWRSKGKAYEEGGVSTAERVSDRIYHGEQYNIIDAELASKATEWAEDLLDKDVEDSDYLFNIRAIARSGMVGVRTFGFAASIISAYNRSQPISNKESKHVGDVKQRLMFSLLFKNSFSFDSSFGYCTKYIFEDSNSNVFVWTTATDKDFQQGQFYNLKGTIKGHSNYKNIKQTVLTRCTILKN